jgi:ankyrin repeat protein
MKDLVVDLNCKGHDHWHALHFASNEGQVEIVEYLLQRPKIEV